MKEFAEFLIKQLVNNTGAVFIDEVADGEYTRIVINVAQEDMPIIIGKGGKNIKSIRNLIRAKAIKEGVRVSVELAEDLTPQQQENPTR